MKCGHVVVVGALLVFVVACADRDAELRERFRIESTALADQLKVGPKDVVQGRDGWLLHQEEVRYLRASSFIGANAPAANDYPPPDLADPVPAILDFHRQLEERGIALVVVPVPVRPVIYPESVLGPDPFADRDVVPNLHHSLQELLAELRQRGIRVIDLTPVFLNQRRHPEHGPVFLPSESHWTPSGITLAAKLVAAEFRQEEWFDGVQKHEFAERWDTIMFDGGLNRNFTIDSEVVIPPDPVQIRRVRLKTNDGEERIELENAESPVIVLGDSNTTYWHQFDSSLGQILAAELGFPVDVHSAEGGGANTSRINFVRKIRQEPAFLDGKRAVVWCITARAFTSVRQGWIQMPLG